MLKQPREFGSDLSEIDETKLIFALNLIDKFSGNFLIGRLEIKFQDPKGRPLNELKQRVALVKKEKFLLIICKNEFPKNLIIEILSEFYKKKYIVISEDKFSTDELADPKPIRENIIDSVNLTPLPNYPFPPTTTLIRGAVYKKEKEDEPVKNAKVVLNWWKRVNSRLIPTKLFTYTTDQGEFVLPIDLSKVILSTGNDAQVNFTTRLITIKHNIDFKMYVEKDNESIGETKSFQIKESFSNSAGKILVEEVNG